LTFYRRKEERGKSREERIKNKEQGAKSKGRKE
jgi:hypothetical protein